jgi:HK97 family phage major capsid protein
MQKRLKELQEKAGQLITDMRKLNDKTISEKRMLTSDEETTYSNMETEYDAAKREITRVEKLIAEDNFMRQTPNRAGFQIAGAPEDNKAIRKQALFNYIRRGIVDAQIMQRDMSEGVAASGGYAVPVEYVTEIREELRKATYLRQICDVITTETTTKIPIEAGIPQAAWIDEGGAYPTSDAALGQVSIGAYKYGFIVKLSDELLEDSSNIETYVRRKIVEAMSYFEEEAFLRANGTNKPTGITTMGVGVTLATATAVAADDVIDLVYSVPMRYRTGSSFLVSDAFEKAVFKLKDTTGNYIWQPSYVSGAPSSILGYPVRKSEFIDGFGSEKIPAIFGNFKTYQIADRGAMYILRLNELYASTGQIGIRVSARVDGKPSRADAIKTLKCPFVSNG